MALRDIRPDLKERMALIEEQVKAENLEYDNKRKALEENHVARAKELMDAWKSLSATLAEENRRFGETQVLPVTSPLLPLDDFFVEVVDQHGTRTKQQLREAAEVAGYFPRGEGGRKTHTTLLNIVRAGRLTMASEDVYAPAPKLGEFQLDQRGALQ